MLYFWGEEDMILKIWENIGLDAIIFFLFFYQILEEINLFDAPISQF